jgi:hypothetical protein
VRLRRCMVEKNSRLAGQLSHIERVLHQQEYIDVGRFPLGGDERPEHHEPSQLASTDSDAIDSFESLRYGDPLPRSLAKAVNRVAKRGTVNSRWKITIFSERWQRNVCRLRHKPFLPQAPHHG